MRLTSADRLLRAVVVAAAVLGLFFVVTAPVTVKVFDSLYFASAPARVAEETRYLKGVYAVLGAVMVGWMVALWPIVNGPLRRRDRTAWNSVVTSVGTWFVLDTAVSAVFIPRNVILNLLFIVGFGVPMAMIRRDGLRVAA